jgi:iron complex outermembrane receptor protein
MSLPRLVCATAIAPLLWAGAHAQDAPEAENTSTAARMMETVTVSAQKKVDAENVQEIPIAITAFGSEQLDALQFRDLADIGSRVPNAVIDEIGSFKGVAAFSVRGQASLSSIPSVDPTVGAFIDGVYYGINAGIMFDSFDLESVEVLRGPQGILFGRNVVGGAVLVNTTRPTDELKVDFRASVDSGFRGTGNNYTYSGVVSGPITDGLNGKIAVYHNHDEGWFKNKFDNEKYGDSKTTIVRGALEWQSTEDLNWLLRLEHGEQESEGTASQSHMNGSGVPGLDFDRDTHDLSLNNRGWQEAEWNQAFLETTLDVGFGDGVITNIFGYRDYDNNQCIDLDATPNTNFDTNCISDPPGSPPARVPEGGQTQEQISNELRYAGRFFDTLDVTAGLYYFDQDVTYSENRSLFNGAVHQAGGGVQSHQVFGVFLNGDYDLSENLILSAGVRYTKEDKDVKIASLGAPKPGTSPAGYCRPGLGECPFDFEDNDSWSNVDYKLGLQYKISDNVRVYGSWATGFRSGGYNLRNSDPADLIGPVDEESVDNFEIGLKSEPTARTRLNIAAFLTKTKDLQRIVISSGPLGTIQTGRNTADAENTGFEIDGQLLVTDNLILMGNLGYLDAEYTKVLYDLSGDGIVDELDLALSLPRTAELTYSGSVIYDTSLGQFGDLSSRLSYSFRDEQAASDNNLAYLNSQEILDLNIGWQPLNSNWHLSLYGKNLLNDVVFNSDTQLPASIGSTAANMKKGRTIGVEARYRF